MTHQGLQKWLVALAGAAALALVVSGCAVPKTPAATAVVGGITAGGPRTVGQGNGAISFTGGGRTDSSTVFTQIYPPVGSSQQLGIWVSGSGRVTAKPDIGVLSFGVEAREATVALARDKAAGAMSAALKALSDKKVADKDVQTQQFSIYPIIVYNQKAGDPNAPTITGYVVTNSATAKIRALDTFGDVIDAVTTAGGNNIRINTVSFSIDNTKPLETQARALALQDAMAKATQIAQVTGVKLGAPLFISESGGSPIIAQKSFAVGLSAAPQASIPTPINPGDSDVTMSVQMVFAIQ